ncbi:MAG TPA: hypothetical protein VGC97_17210 [Pyrinomonadaceae bacterium]
MSVFLGSLQGVDAQSTLFNIPSTDVVPEKKVYLEFDFISHLESYENGGFQAYIPRAVVGLGKKVEVGVNVAFTRSGVLNPVEIQPNIKYQPYRNEKYGAAVSTGVILYAPITRRAGTNTFAMVYGNVSKQFEGGSAPRVTGGGYGLINRASGTGDKGGVMVGFEQPITRKVKFVADWFSGKNRFGYGTPGLSITTGKTSALYAGYSIGNSGRKNNSLFIYWGITL